MLNNEELLMIKGGSITGALIDSVTKMMEKIYDLGRSLGSSIRRLVSGKTCKI